MSDLNKLEQKSVDFYGDKIVAVKLENGDVYVPIRPICDRLGIDRRSQQRRIERDPVLSEQSRLVVIDMSRAITAPLPDSSGAITTPQPKAMPGQRRTREMLAIPLDYLNGWLFGISASRVKASVRDALIRYQRDCYKILAQAFLENTVVHKPLDIDLDALLASDDPTAVAYRHAMAIANIAKEQLVLKAQVDARIGSAENKLVEHDVRLELIEAELGNPDRFISVSQAEQLSQAVRAVGLIFSKVSGRNEYGGVYGELHRRFSINSYKRLPAAKFEDALNWLRQWHEDLADGDEAPF